MTRPAFHGYRRPDGCFGIRNHVAVISAMDNVNPVVRKIAAGLRGVLPIWAAYGRGMFGDDAQQHFQTLVGYGTHPNVAAVLVVSMEPWAIYGVLMILSVFPQALMRFGISDVESKLDMGAFFRIHRSTIVNVRRIDFLRRDEMGRLRVHMKGRSESLIVSRTFEHTFKGV